MYKVFVNEKPIILTSSIKNENNFLSYNFNDINLEEIIYKLKFSNAKGIYLYTNNLEQSWQDFLSSIDVVKAAGGLVQNTKKDFLFIFRNNKWDLPKGRIESGEAIEEAAIREVEEECSIFNLKINKKLTDTYHIYYQKGNKLKITYWFLMSSDYQKPLKPQFEEGITKAEFIKESEIENYLEKSYSNIKLVYDSFKEND